MAAGSNRPWNEPAAEDVFGLQPNHNCGMADPLGLTPWNAGTEKLRSRGLFTAPPMDVDSANNRIYCMC